MPELRALAGTLRAAPFYLKQGFVFLDEWEPLESHPHITLQTMRWTGD